MADENDSGHEPVGIVGVGGSAGSLQPMIDLIQKMPDDSGIAFVIVHHADASSRSQLPEILERHTTMSVTTADDNLCLQPNTVYVVPGHMYVTVQNDSIGIAKSGRDGAFDVIDFFFRSLAESRADGAIGVLLSGTGSDGAQGLREIRTAGGLSIAQDPGEASYPSMPESAIRTGFVDRVLEVSQMPHVIVAYCNYKQVADPEKSRERQEREEDQGTIEAIVSFLQNEHQADFRYYKRSTVERRIRRRMGVCQIDDMRAYHRHLQADPEEGKQLARDMLIGVTSFFRDPKAFEELRENVIKPIVESKKQDEPVRIWVPGAATGEEAYSIAILVRDVMVELGKSLEVKIFASDVDPDAMHFAREGIYPDTIRADVPDEYLESYFNKRDHSYQVSERLRDDLVFATHNMLSDPPFSHLDLISCRNVLIYIQSEMQETVYRVFGFALKAGGYLFLGRSDAVSDTHDLFTQLDGEGRILRRTDAEQKVIDLPTRARVRGIEPTRRSRLGVPDELTRLNQDVLLAHFSAAVVLTDENGKVQHFFGPTSKYLQHPTGHATLNVFDMAPEALGTRLRTAMRHALDEDEQATLDDVRINDDGKGLSADITVIPMRRRENETHLVAFIFESPWRRQALAAGQKEGETQEGDKRRGRQLETDLEATRQDLQATIGELERANQDLVTANEEIMSMNEELQSANEELETSKEELQSVNEELTTVNQQLSEKVGQLTQTNADLENLLKAADIMAIFLSKDLTIRRFSPAATRLLNLITTDVGRPISHISHNLQDLDLPPKAQHVLDTGERIEEEVRDTEGNWYIMRIHPYSKEENVEGVVINFSNVTRVKQAEEVADRRSAKLRDLARQITETEQAERHRVAGLIHDEIQQMLAGAKLKVKSLASLGEKPETEKAVGDAVDLLEDATDTARTLTRHLSPPVLRDAGFIAAMNWLAAECNRLHELDVDVQVDNRTEPGSTTLALFLVDATREFLFNVAKHAETDHAELRLTREDGMVRITVCDEGKGFDACELEERGDDLGFGLVGIARRAELLGGELDLESVPGGGCRATLAVPAEVFDRKNAPPQSLRDYETKAREANGDGEPLRVLIVDDHEMMRDGLAQMLAPTEGLEIVGRAADGEEGVKMADGLAPDVILMDIGMEPMNGIEAARIIKEQHPEIRIIGLSVHEEGELSQEILDAGAEAFLTKGAPLEELVAAVRGKGGEEMEEE